MTVNIENIKDLACEVLQVRLSLSKKAGFNLILTGERQVQQQSVKSNFIRFY